MERPSRERDDNRRAETGPGGPGAVVTGASVGVVPPPCGHWLPWSRGGLLGSQRRSGRGVRRSLRDGGEVLGVAADMSVPEESTRSSRRVGDELGPVDILVNAGAGGGQSSKNDRRGLARDLRPT
jgi:hypothetical protein